MAINRGPRVIHKYEICDSHEPRGSYHIEMNRAKSFGFGEQDGKIVHWVAEEKEPIPANSKVLYQYNILYTGEEIPYKYRHRHASTLQLGNGLVVHIFRERVPK